MERIKTFLPDKKELTQFFAVAMCLFMFMSFVMVSNLSVAYCADTQTMADSITDIITLGASKIYSIFRAILIPIVICLLGYNGLLILGGSPQSITTAKKQLIGLFIGSVLIVFAPVIGKEVGGWLNNSSAFTGDLGDYNPLA